VDIRVLVFQEIKRKTALGGYDYWIVKTDSHWKYSMAEYTLGGSGNDLGCIESYSTNC
jgi:hypothetical protein